jgi:beta-galactosidase
MEYANHEGLRWAALTGDELPGLMIEAQGELLHVSAAPYTEGQMTPVEYKIDLPPSETTRVANRVAVSSESLHVLPRRPTS